MAAKAGRAWLAQLAHQPIAAVGQVRSGMITVMLSKPCTKAE